MAALTAVPLMPLERGFERRKEKTKESENECRRNRRVDGRLQERERRVKREERRRWCSAHKLAADVPVMKESCFVLAMQSCHAGKAANA